MPNLFPYTNTHELNLDWILQVVKDFQTKYTNFDQALADALAAISAGKTEALDEISTDLTAALNDIEASQTAALTAIGNTKDSALSDIGAALTSATNAISALNTTVQNEITTLKNTSLSEITTAQGTAISAITASMNHATTIIEQLYNTLPSSAQDIINRMNVLDDIITGNVPESFVWLQGDYIYPEGVTPPTPPAIYTESQFYNYRVSSRYMTGVGGRRIRIITDGSIEIAYLLNWRNTPPGGSAGAYIPGEAGITETFCDLLLPMNVTAISIELKKPGDSVPIAPTDIDGHIEIQWITDFVSQRIIAPKESSTTADVARATGEYFFLDGDLYIATDDIDIGDTIAEGTNCEKKTVGGELTELKSAMTEIMPVNLLSRNNTDGYIGTDGTIYPSTTMQYSDFIAVTPGDIVYSYKKQGNSFAAYPLRFITAYNQSKTPLQSKGLNNTTDQLTFTILDDVAYIRVTIIKSEMGNGNGMVTLNTIPTVWHDYFRPYYTATTKFLGKSLSANVKDAIAQKCFTTSGDLSDGDILTLPDTNVNKNKIIAFSGDIIQFSGLQVGRYTNANVGYLVKVTTTDLIVWRDGAETTYQHGLTIQNNIQLRIIKTDDEAPNKNTYVNVYITSNGVQYKSPDIYFVREYGNIIAKSIGSILSDCRLSYIPRDIDKKIWMFGDSYFSWIPERWVYYLAQDGNADDCLINGYSGETSTDAIAALQNLLTIGCPKYIVWCLGMNDDSDNGAPTQRWKNGIDTLLYLCNEYGIIPILATIPTVPSVNNEYKNSWVRNSNYRYIDFAKAVGATSSGVWYGDMLSNDSVHPTADGARALYGRALVDFPELGMIN